MGYNPTRRTVTYGGGAWRRAPIFQVTLKELIERLDIETDCLGENLREAMKGDTSSVEAIKVDYELAEGGDEEWQREYLDEFKEDTFFIKSFVVWTQGMVYHSESDDCAHLYEDGRIYAVRRHPNVKK